MGRTPSEQPATGVDERAPEPASGPGEEARPPDRPWRVEGMQQQPPAGGKRPSPRRHWGWLRWLVLLLLLLPLNWLIASSWTETEQTGVSYSFFLEQVDRGNVSEVTVEEDHITGTLKVATAYPSTGGTQSQVTGFSTYRPTFADDNVIETLVSKGVTVTAEPDVGAPLWQELLVGFGPTFLLIGLLMWWVGRSAKGGLGGLAGLGPSRAELYKGGGPRTTFDDVAGIDEVEEEVMEVVDFLKNPERYLRLGATIPKGVLLSGAPGTGKTLLARAVAGEANVPFFHISASEFIEMIVGVGARRVRELFDQAKQAAPSIIFIDELDAIGRARGGNVSFGGHDEREQTLNQILTEMDGFTGAEGVVVLAATNRPEILDPALLRAGRFDRKIHINAPDRNGREQILRVHTRGVPLAA